MSSSPGTVSGTAGDLESNTTYVAEGHAKDSTGNWTNVADVEFTTNSSN